MAHTGPRVALWTVIVEVTLTVAVIVEVGQGDDRQWLVLGITGQQIRTLHVMPPQADVGAALQSAQPSFAHMLKRSLGGRQVDGTGPGL